MELNSELGRLRKYSDIDRELYTAKVRHPDYPTDMYQQLAILTEEAGEVAKAVNDYHTGSGTIDELREELQQTAAMCMRMLENLEEVRHEECKHSVKQITQNAIGTINTAICYYGCSKGKYCEEPCERRDRLVRRLTEKSTCNNCVMVNDCKSECREFGVKTNSPCANYK